MERRGGWRRGQSRRRGRSYPYGRRLRPVLDEVVSILAIPSCIRIISFFKLPNSFFNSILDANSSLNSTVLPVEAWESQPVALVHSLYLALRPVMSPFLVRCVSLGCGTPRTGSPGRDELREAPRWCRNMRI